MISNEKISKKFIDISINGCGASEELIDEMLEFHSAMREHKLY